MWECYSKAMTTHLAQDCFVFSKDSPSPYPYAFLMCFHVLGFCFSFLMFLGGFFFRRVGVDHFTFSLPAIPWETKPCNRYEEPESGLVCFSVTTSSGAAPHLSPHEQAQHQSLGICSAGAALELHILLQAKGSHGVKYGEVAQTHRQQLKYQVAIPNLHDWKGWGICSNLWGQ